MGIAVHIGENRIIVHLDEEFHKPDQSGGIDIDLFCDLAVWTGPEDAAVWPVCALHDIKAVAEVRVVAGTLK